MQNGPAYPAAYPSTYAATYPSAPLSGMPGAPGQVASGTPGSVEMNANYSMPPSSFASSSSSSATKASAKASAPLGYVPPPVQSSYPGGYYGQQQGGYNPMQYGPPPPLIPPYGPAMPHASGSGSAGYYAPYYGYGHPPQPNAYGNQMNQYYNHNMTMPYQPGSTGFPSMAPPPSQHQINANGPHPSFPVAPVTTTTTASATATMTTAKTNSGPIQHKSVIVPDAKDRTAMTTVGAPEVPKDTSAATKLSSFDSNKDTPEFTKALKDYISRAFKQCKNANHRSVVEAKLRDLVRDAMSSGTIASKDWDTFALPSVEPVNQVSANANSSWAPKDQADWTSNYNQPTKFSLGKGTRRKRKFSQTPWPTEGNADGSEENGASRDGHIFKNPKFPSSQDSSLNDKRQHDHSEDISSSYPGKKKGFHSRKYKPRQKAFGQSPPSAEAADISSFPAVKGTSQELEKDYLRLTEAPDPASVRPESVLKKSVAFVMAKFNENSDYYYISDQLKSIRQDLTVQCIQNELTVEVYEIHARLSIRYEDMNEYNQCQTQLMSLYKKGHRQNFAEFLAYRIIYVAIYNESSSVTCEVLQSITSDIARDERIVHALNVRKSIVSRNYVNFFRCIKSAPSDEARCLMSLYIETCRFDAIKCICIAYQTLAVSMISKVLDFSLDVEEEEDDNDDAIVACVKWLESHGAVFTHESKGILDCRKSSSRLHVPEREDAVAHGDENMSFANFLSSK